MKLALVGGDLVAFETSNARLRELGAPATAFLQLESLQLRTVLATRFLEYGQARELSRQMLDALAPGDPRRVQALGGIAAATAHLALQGLESREGAEALVREALQEEERVGLSLWYPEIGYLPSRLQLALLLGPGAESVALVRSALEGYRARAGWTNPVWAQLALGELLATADPPALDEALRLSEEAIEASASSDHEDAGRVASFLLRSRIRFKLGRFAQAREEGLVAVALAEQLRGGQSEIRMRQRYAESLSFAHRLLAGDLMSHRAPNDSAALDAALQVMERFRARGLMETLLAHEGSERSEPAPQPDRPPGITQLQAALSSREALLSFVVWRPEPTMEAPFREGSSWLTVITRTGVEAFQLPNGDALEPRVRAWTGLLPMLRPGSPSSRSSIRSIPTNGATCTSTRRPTPQPGFRGTRCASAPTRTRSSRATPRRSSAACRPRRRRRRPRG